MDPPKDPQGTQQEPRRPPETPKRHPNQPQMTPKGLQGTPLGRSKAPKRHLGRYTKGIKKKQRKIDVATIAPPTTLK